MLFYLPSSLNTIEYSPSTDGRRCCLYRYHVENKCTIEDNMCSSTFDAHTLLPLTLLIPCPQSNFHRFASGLPPPKNSPDFAKPADAIRCASHGGGCRYWSWKCSLCPLRPNCIPSLLHISSALIISDFSIPVLWLITTLMIS